MVTLPPSSVFTVIIIIIIIIICFFMLLYFCRMYYVCVYGNFVCVKFTICNLIVSSVTMFCNCLLTNHISYAVCTQVRNLSLYISPKLETEWYIQEVQPYGIILPSFPNNTKVINDVIYTNHNRSCWLIKARVYLNISVHLRFQLAGKRNMQITNMLRMWKEILYQPIHALCIHLLPMTNKTQLNCLVCVSGSETYLPQWTQLIIHKANKLSMGNLWRSTQRLSGRSLLSDCRIILQDRSKFHFV
jgi:hypothetical protein